MAKKYSKRDVKEFNLFREVFQYITCSWVYAFYYRIAVGLEVKGKENIPKDKNKFYIVASNHLSAIDPFLMVHAVGRPIAFMAKKELFEKPIMRIFMDLLGAFSVNREKLDVSTIKTALSLKKTTWKLGLFPQGRREEKLDIENVSRGFASIAKALKCDILPIGISGAEKSERAMFKRNTGITITIGKPIPYNEDIQQMIKDWVDKVNELITESK